MDMTNLQTYLIPALYILYAVVLLVKQPAMGANGGFNIQRARKSEAAWRYTQTAACVYCVVSAVILILCIRLLDLPALVQTGLELLLVICMYPVINGLLKKKFPD